MSGHSKWHKIKHKKEAVDKKKSKQFSHLTRELATAARAGADPATNFKLREVIERAKKANLPQDNIDRLLRQDAAERQTIIYEGFSRDGAALLILAASDKPNRTVAEIRQIFKTHGASLGTANSVRWKFQVRRENGQLYYRVPVNQQQTLAADAKQNLLDLLAELNNHPDISAIYTDAL